MLRQDTGKTPLYRSARWRADEPDALSWAEARLQLMIVIFLVSLFGT